MKLNRTLGLLMVAASAGVGASTAATTPTTTAATAPTAIAAAATAPMAGNHWHHRHGSMLVGTMLRAAHQLNLTPEQQQTIKGMLSAARSRDQQADAASMDMAVLGNPGDPNYATAVQAAKSRLATRLQNEIELQGQIYDVLTAEQKAQLPQVLAGMKAKAEQRRAAWRQRHGGGAGPASGSN